MFNLSLTLLFPVLVFAATEHAFTVDYNDSVKERETCRPFESLRNKSITGASFEQWCPAIGKTVYVCSGAEKFYLIKFPDQSSCQAVLQIMKEQAKR